MSRNQSPASDPFQQRRALWLKIALGICLVLLLGWLNVWLSGGSAPAGKEAAKPDRASKHSTSEVDRQSPVEKGERKGASRRKSESTDGDSGDELLERDREGDGQFVVHNVRVTNEDGDVVYRGDVDLKPTLGRIDRGEHLRFSHDGLVFENHEHRLPSRPRGYYHEFVQPTPGDAGPGGQRLVIGKDGEAFYSPDHYHTFRRVR